MSLFKYLYVYILKCSDGTYYTGITNNPELRLQQHNAAISKDSYTASRLPVEMVYCEAFSDFILAINWEKRIKKWSQRKKEALINEKWDILRIEAACKNETSSINYEQSLRLQGI